MAKKHTKVLRTSQAERTRESIDAAVETLRGSALYGLLQMVDIECGENYPMSRSDWACVSADGVIYTNPGKDATPQEWAYIIAHCLLHLALDHFKPEFDGNITWNIACDLVVSRFLRDCRGIGSPPVEFDTPVPLPAKDERFAYESIAAQPDLVPSGAFSTMSNGRPDMTNFQKKDSKRDFPKAFADSLQESLLDSVAVAVGRRYRRSGVWEVARDWFISHYPLLGALASDFKLVEVEHFGDKTNIPIAAVSPQLKEIYINQSAKLDEMEWRFVLAHEILHAALRHDVRIEGRDPVVWNIATDFVINDWLLEMHVGEMPDGVLYDSAFHGMSAEAVYDVLMENVRQYKQMNPKDLIYGDEKWWDTLEGMSLDEYFRSAMRRGLEYHINTGRGTIPGNFVEEIRSISKPPIPWDVELANWFDEHFQLSEPRRTYARLSRRQASTPAIPRPATVRQEEHVPEKTFGVVLDTSGSMDRSLLAAALGSIVSYSEARDVKHVRVVFCDAHPYDQGVISPEQLVECVEVRGRGGTRLQPGINLLDADKNFPKDAPVLIITDGYCERLNLRGREHAYLLPKGNRFPFPARGPVFYLD